ncbi:MAG TPA: thioredoxin domain-containing protein [Gaiellales bacterium]|jgi:protein-disulfide isomerase|nr:thioredoxin domain-containing protein [Gaiellales bacterium]
MGKALRTRALREQERRRARMRRMLVAGGTAVLLVVALVVIQQVTSSSGGRPDARNLQGVATVKAEFAGLNERAGTIGNANAQITITEFGDLRCPICKTFDNDVAPQVISDIVRPGTAKLQYKTWPILGPNSVEAAKAAYAARQQNALWPYASLAYLNQGDENIEWFTPAVARALAKGVGLDLARFEKDRASAAATKAITQVTNEATRLGFQGTPTIRVAGPKGTVTVNATYDAIANGVQQVSGSAG